MKHFTLGKLGMIAVTALSLGLQGCSKSSQMESAESDSVSVPDTQTRPVDGITPGPSPSLVIPPLIPAPIPSASPSVVPSSVPSVIPSPIVSPVPSPAPSPMFSGGPSVRPGGSASIFLKHCKDPRPSVASKKTIQAVLSAVQASTCVQADQALARLAELDLSHEGLSDLVPLSGMQGLKSLSLKGSRLSSAGALAPLANLVMLEKLDLASSGISDVQPLSGLVRLRELNLSVNRLTSLLPLAGLTSLEALYVSDNRGLRTLNGVQPLMALQVLHASGCQISQVFPVVNLQKLRKLVLHLNRISDVKPLYGLKGLGELSLAQNPIPRAEQAALQGRLGTGVKISF